eukprot:4273676-Pyramimonas_sp.AAC.2
MRVALVAGLNPTSHSSRADDSHAPPVSTLLTVHGHGDAHAHPVTHEVAVGADGALGARPHQPGVAKRLQSRPLRLPPPLLGFVHLHLREGVDAHPPVLLELLDARPQPADQSYAGR